MSPPSPLHPCPYYGIAGHSKVEFSSEDLMERHVVQKHASWTAYPGDLLMVDHTFIIGDGRIAEPPRGATGPVFIYYSGFFK